MCQREGLIITEDWRLLTAEFESWGKMDVPRLILVEPTITDHWSRERSLPRGAAIDGSALLLFRASRKRSRCSR